MIGFSSLHLLALGSKNKIVTFHNLTTEIYSCYMVPLSKVNCRYNSSHAKMYRMQSSVTFLALLKRPESAHPGFLALTLLFHIPRETR